MGTRARLTWISCAIAKSVFCHYTVCYLYVCACVSTHMLYIGVWKHACVFASSPRDMRMQNFNNLGNARVCPGLQAPMCEQQHQLADQCSYIFCTQIECEAKHNGDMEMGHWLCLSFLTLIISCYITSLYITSLAPIILTAGSMLYRP